jgi:hypothetical protein
MDWSSWIQEVGKTAVDVYAAKEKAEQAYDIQRLQLQQQLTAAAGTPAAAFAGVSPTVLIVGAVALVGLLLVAGKD